ncbi:IPT/TIG domain-containing protein [Nonomuraea sp. NPDC004297]
MTGISPASGPDSGGTTVTITGHEFDPQDSQCFAGSVTFGGVSAPSGCSGPAGWPCLTSPASWSSRRPAHRAAHLGGPDAALHPHPANRRPDRPQALHPPRPQGADQPRPDAPPHAPASCTRRSSALPWAR